MHTNVCIGGEKFSIVAIYVSLSYNGRRINRSLASEGERKARRKGSLTRTVEHTQISLTDTILI